MAIRHNHLVPWCLMAILLSTLPSSARGANPVDTLLDQIGVTRGICVVVGDPRGDMALKLAGQSQLLVYVQLADSPQVAALRQAAEAAKLGATRIQVGQGDLQRLNLASNLADAVVVVGSASTPESELLRVLRPRGKVIMGEKTIVKPVPSGTDDWSHPYHGPDNNPLSRDTQIVAPYLTQFLADPRYGPAPQVAVSAGGRIFKAYGNVAWHEREEPFLNSVVAYDGYNGTLLWQYKLPEGMMVHRNVFIATPDILFLGDDYILQVDRHQDRARFATRSIRRKTLPVARSGNGWPWKTGSSMPSWASRK